MPELPEVETIRMGLASALKGQKIKRVAVAWAKSFPLAAKSVGHSVKDVRRRGKVLILELDRDMSLLIHLKMTGQLVFITKRGQRFAGGHPTESMEHELPDRSTRATFIFASGDRLFFNDQRKFGWIKLVESAHVNLDKLLARMGPEPLSKEFNLSTFSEAVSRSRAPIKAVLLDQSTVAGVGNIYADESLHLAKIHPATRSLDLSKAQVMQLFKAVKVIITRGIKYGGTSFTSYVNALGKQGNYLEHARVFRRQGQPCPVCGTTITKIRVAGRGTHICPYCQPSPKVRRTTK